MLGRAFQTCNLKNKNCSEFLRTKGMGLDRAPSNFFTLVFLDPPTVTESLVLPLYFGHIEWITITDLCTHLSFRQSSTFWYQGPKLDDMSTMFYSDNKIYKIKLVMDLITIQLFTFDASSGFALMVISISLNTWWISFETHGRWCLKSRFLINLSHLHWSDHLWGTPKLRNRNFLLK